MLQSHCTPFLMFYLNSVCSMNCMVFELSVYKSWDGCARIKPVSLVAISVPWSTLGTMKQSLKQRSEHETESWELKSWKRKCWLPSNSSGLKTINTQSYCDVQSVSAESEQLAPLQQQLLYKVEKKMLRKYYYYHYHYYYYCYFLSFENS